MSEFDIITTLATGTYLPENCSEELLIGLNELTVSGAMEREGRTGRPLHGPAGITARDGVVHGAGRLHDLGFAIDRRVGGLFDFLSEGYDLGAQSLRFRRLDLLELLQRRLKGFEKCCRGREWYLFPNHTSRSRGTKVYHRRLLGGAEACLGHRVQIRIATMIEIGLGCAGQACMKKFACVAIDRNRHPREPKERSDCIAR